MSGRTVPPKPLPPRPLHCKSGMYGLFPLDRRPRRSLPKANGVAAPPTRALSSSGSAPAPSSPAAVWYGPRRA